MATPGGSDASTSSSSSMFSSSSSMMSSSSGDSSSSIRSSATNTEPTSLTIRVLQEITDNFSEDRVLGQGAYGKVYKGRFENGEEIAVKMLYNNIQAIDNENFQHEFTNLMMLDHENIIRLVAYCYETQYQHKDLNGRMIFPETTHKALCFEYMHMGSLQRNLSDETLGLDWKTSYKIIKGTCEGLKYLHEGLKEPIYHLDLKPDNILLDKNMVPKLADFGMSKLFAGEQTRATHAFGTLGYMPPEYFHGKVVSKKFDIFSLGVVITQILSGLTGHSRSAEMTLKEYLDQVNENWRNRLQATCTTQALEANCEQVSICTEIGLRCMDEDRHKRPSIVDIIHMMEVTETLIEKGTTLRKLLSSTTIDDKRMANVPASSFSDATAKLYCRQIVDYALRSIESREDYKLLKAEESPRRFRDISDTLLESIITMYDSETQNYDPKVRDNERQYMVEKLRKVLKEDSWELIRKIQKDASEQFKLEYTKNLKSMEESDSELMYDDLILESCIGKFMNLCEDLKVFDSDYLYKKRGELQKHLHLYAIHHILTIKETRWRKATEQSQQRSDKNLEEVKRGLEEAIKERHHAEAEMIRLKEKQVKDELEYTEKMHADEQERATNMLPKGLDQIEKMLADAKKQVAMLSLEKLKIIEKMLADKEKEREMQRPRARDDKTLMLASHPNRKERDDMTLMLASHPCKQM